MNNVAGTVHGRSRASPDDKSAVFIDAVRDSLYVPLRAQLHEPGGRWCRTARMAAREGHFQPALPIGRREFKCGQHSGNDRRTRWRRPPSSRAAIASEVALGTGSCSSSRLTLIPIPTTQTGPWEVSTRSERMPQTLRPATSTSLGHLSTAGRLAARRTPSETADPPTMTASPSGSDRYRLVAPGWTSQCPTRAVPSRCGPAARDRQTGSR